MAIKIYNAGMLRNIRMGKRPNGVFSAPELVSDAGKPMEGGYYAGGNIVVDGKEYVLIVAPKAVGESDQPWKTSNTATLGTDSTYNGRNNTDAMLSAGGDLHPAAKFVSELTIAGHSDWHLPSPDELEICYRFLKPTTDDNHTDSKVLHNGQICGYNPNSSPQNVGYEIDNPQQTTVPLFQEGGSESFSTATWHCSSMQYDVTTRWAQFFGSGIQNNGSVKVGSMIVRAVRWVEV